jgi:hypothetical protein
LNTIQQQINNAISATEDVVKISLIRDIHNALYTLAYEAKIAFDKNPDNSQNKKLRDILKAGLPQEVKDAASYIIPGETTERKIDLESNTLLSATDYAALSDQSPWPALGAETLGNTVTLYKK